MNPLQSYLAGLLRGDVVGAATEWQRYSELVPQDSLGYYQAGRLLNAQQLYDKAEASLRLAIAIRPSRTDGWIELGNAAALQDNYPEALACYSTALKQDSRSAPSLVGRGRVLARLGRHADAR